MDKLHQFYYDFERLKQANASVKSKKAFDKCAEFVSYLNTMQTCDKAALTRISDMYRTKSFVLHIDSLTSNGTALYMSNVLKAYIRRKHD